MRTMISCLARLAALVSTAVMVMAVAAVDRHDLMGTPFRVCLAAGIVAAVSVAIDLLVDSGED